MAQTQPDKVIVSNVAVLTQKYRAAGAARVGAASRNLVTSDARRGIVSVFVDLSDAATMSNYGVAAIPAAQATNAQLNKTAIDAVFQKDQPAYLTLLGSTDVIPHVPLANPMLGDGDADLPSDLPYACGQPYSTNVQDFTAPTRVVSRLPDVTHGSKPAYLVGVLGTAARHSQQPAAKYSAFLGISAQVWKVSSQMSLAATFGTNAGMKVSPTDGPRWTVAEAKRQSHFVNCHGAPADPNFYGQRGSSYRSE